MHVGERIPSPGEILDYLCYFEHRGETFPIKIHGVSSGYSNMTNVHGELDRLLHTYVAYSSDRMGIESKEKFRALREVVYIAHCKHCGVLIDFKSTFNRQKFKRTPLSIRVTRLSIAEIFLIFDLNLLATNK